MSLRKFLSLLVQDRSLAPRLRLLRLAGKVLVPSYRFKWPQLDWWRNEEFTAYLRRFGELAVLNTDRKWMVYQLLRLIAHIPGDTAECGVYRGATSYLICRANQEAAHWKVHHLFDSFAGLSEPGLADGTHWWKGDLRNTLAETQRTLAEFEKATSYHRGWIPTRFREVADCRFSFVHIDVDLAQPTHDSIEFFYPRMNIGGIIVCDDYGQTICPGATEAIDHFFSNKPEKMISLPDGGGFVIINTPTAPSATVG